jgi:hypothetical protein
MENVRALPALVALGLVAALLPGCSSGEEETPAACLNDAEIYLEALRNGVPGEVLVEGETPVGDCLVPDQNAAELGTVGASLIEAATRLNAAARRNPSGPEAVQLGYLVGAVQQGAEDTEGSHTDLIRRLDAAARFAPGGQELPVEFERTFGRGYAAGQQSG